MSQYRLTPAQEAIWIGQKLHPEEPLYNMVMLFTIEGEIDVLKFSGAFDQLVAECEILRTVFNEVDGEVYQRLSTSHHKPLEYIEVNDSDFNLEEWATVRGRKVLLLNESNFDSALIKHGTTTYTWFINQHHIATDLSSFRALYTRLNELYHNNNDESKRLPSYFSYLDEAVSSSPVVNNKGSNARPADVAAAFGKVLPKVFSSRSSRIEVPIPDDLIESLNTLLEKDSYKIINNNIGRLTFFYGLLAVLLNKIKGNDTYIGLPTHNRYSDKRKRLPGLIMSVFPLAPANVSDATFKQLFETNKNVIFNYLLESQRNENHREKLVQIESLLNYIPFDFYSFGDLHCNAKWLHIGYHDAQHYLRMHVQTNSLDKINISFDLNDTVFSTVQQELVKNAFLRLVETAVADDEMEIGKWSFLSAGEKMASFGNSQLTLGSNLPIEPILTGFQNSVMKFPDNLVLQEGQSKMTYAGLNDYTNQLANYFSAFGLKVQHRVGVLIDSYFIFPQVVVALLKCNAVLVPIDTSYPEERIAFMLEQAKCSLLVTTKKFSNKYAAKVDHVIALDEVADVVANSEAKFVQKEVSQHDLIYVLYTSGTSGRPKGVQITHANIANYLGWAKAMYVPTGHTAFYSAFFTSVGFDLTYTSLFLPLVTGGTIYAYGNFSQNPVGILEQIFSDSFINLIKLTPSHIHLLSGMMIDTKTQKSIIVGGEQLTDSAVAILKTIISSDANIFNEYGPTEATIGCIIHRVNGMEVGPAVPIGKLAPGMQALVLNDAMQEVAPGLSGELYLGGAQVAFGYENALQQTIEKFVKIEGNNNTCFYKTGDIVRLNSSFEFEYIGRKDGQFKIGSRRVEKEEIENVIAQFDGITACAVTAKSLLDQSNSRVGSTSYCTQCGIPDNYPGIEFNPNGKCNICEKYEVFKERSSAYFKNTDELYSLLGNANGKEYDCIVLLSGGKDSSFALAKLAEQKFRILAFTLDNGFLSREAMGNIDRVVAHIGVDHIWAKTPAMNEVFVDSLNRYANVCDGCFKVIYTMAIQLALDKKIPYIVTGLSRGQFFETRLTEELFLNPEIDAEKIDEHILEARKAYHKVDDAVKRLVASQQLFESSTFQEVKFLDFYRYYDVSYSEMLQFLTTELPWLRPQDTGRSTNCLINDLGIYVHKKQRGFHNYALPYSWDVRLGHKSREQAIKEFDDQLQEAEIFRMAHKIGYGELELHDDALVAFYVANEKIDEHQLRVHLQRFLPAFMSPSQLIEMPELPLTTHGKIDLKKLALHLNTQQRRSDGYIAPRNDIEDYLSKLWAQFLQIEKVSVFDNFVSLGGHSLVAIRILARLEKDLGIRLPLAEVFEKPSVAAMASHIEQIMEEGLREN